MNNLLKVFLLTVMGSSSVVAADWIDRTFNMYDRNRDGLIVRGEMSSKMRYKFRSYDINGDGMLNRREYRAMYLGVRNSRRGYNQNNRRAALGSFNYYDTNRNGFISRNELTGNLKGQFYAFDMNGDNRISRNEFRSAIREQKQGGDLFSDNPNSGGSLKQDYGERFEKKDALDDMNF
jgi:Ca2+-binding EF-hand superfamily protein